MHATKLRMHLASSRDAVLALPRWISHGVGVLLSSPLCSFFHCLSFVLIRFVFSFFQDRFLPPKTGLSVHVMEDGMGDAEAALGRLAKKGMDSGMMRDWTFHSPLAPNTNRYEKPTQFRQRIERKGFWNARQNALLTILRTVLFKKVRS